MSLRIKKGDKVAIIAGKDKGKTGKVLKFISCALGLNKSTRFVQDRVVVEGVNLVKKHIRRRSENEPGGIKEIPIALSIANVALFCGNCNRGVRFKVKALEDKTKIRICNNCQKPI